MRRFTFLSLFALLLVCTSVAFAARPGVPDKDWGPNEPFLAVTANGEVIVGDRSYTGDFIGRDSAYDAVRTVFERNPGLFDQYIAKVLAPLAVDAAKGHGHERITFGQLRKLNAQVRLAYVENLQVYVERVRDSLQNGTPASDLPVFTATWYEPVTTALSYGSTAGGLRKTQCDPKASPCGSAYCPTSCVSGCDSAGNNCQVGIVHMAPLDWWY